jgi:hypothetical protein
MRMMMKKNLKAPGISGKGYQYSALNTKEPKNPS